MEKLSEDKINKGLQDLLTDEQFKYCSEWDLNKKNELLLSLKFKDATGLEPALTAYIKSKRNQDECIGFIDGFETVLSIMAAKEPDGWVFGHRFYRKGYNGLTKAMINRGTPVYFSPQPTKEAARIAIGSEVLVNDNKRFVRENHNPKGYGVSSSMDIPAEQSYFVLNEFIKEAPHKLTTEQIIKIKKLCEECDIDDAFYAISEIKAIVSQ